jgi:small-conductance mechanosensitive channel
MIHIPYPGPTIGTAITFTAAWLIYAVGHRYISRHIEDPRERYSRRKLLTTGLVASVVIVLIVLWSSELKNTGVFLGLLGAGVAVALKEPLLSIFGRMAILAGNIYTVGDRVELDQTKGDVIDVGFMYTRLMEIGNWVAGDMATGRTVQFLNSKVFSGMLFNYTSHFKYIWDEIHLPITYASNLKAMNRILLSVGGDYTREFLAGAEAQLEAMGRDFLVPQFQLRPVVYVQVTSNWVECALRYIVVAKERRAASSFIFRNIFEKIQERDDIQIASQTQNITIYQPPADKPEAQPEAHVKPGMPKPFETTSPPTPEMPGEE